MGCTDCPGQVNSTSNLYYLVYHGGDPRTLYGGLQHVIPTPNDTIPQYGQITIVDDCIKYIGGQEPPTPEGWKKVSQGLFSPDWPICVNRAHKVKMLDSGLLQIDGVCFNKTKKEPAIFKSLTLLNCQQCTHREHI